MKIARFFAFCLISFALLGSTLFGQSSVDGIEVKNLSGAASDPIFIGDNVSYKALVSVQNAQVVNFTWRYKWNFCDPQAAWVDPWVNSGTNPVVTTQENKCGSQTIEVTVTFRPYPQGGATYTSTKSIVVNIEKPNGSELITNPSPLNTDVAPVPAGGAPNLAVRFRVLGNGRPLYFQGTALEAITRPNGYANPFHFDDIAMGPQAGITFTAPGIITDWKAIFDNGVNGGFASIGPVPFVLDEFNQSLATEVPMGCGGTQQANLGTYHFKQVKTGANVWQLQLIP